jgi:hypothetical protein
LAQKGQKVKKGQKGEKGKKGRKERKGRRGEKDRADGRAAPERLVQEVRRGTVVPEEHEGPKDCEGLVDHEENLDIHLRYGALESPDPLPGS